MHGVPLLWKSAPWAPHVLGFYATDEEYCRQKRRNLVDKQSRKSQNSQRQEVQGATEYSRHHSEQRYIDQRQQRQRKKTTKVAIVAIVAVVVCVIVVGALAYASTLNSRITTKDDNLLASLKESSPNLYDMLTQPDLPVEINTAGLHKLIPDTAAIKLLL